MPKRKPIRWQDAGLRQDEVERRPVEWRGLLTLAEGKSSVKGRCPFCNWPVTALVWSLAGSGKRCPECKALLSWHGYAIQWKEAADEGD